MTRLRRFGVAVLMVVGATAQAAAADPLGDYANAWLGERLCTDRSTGSWRQSVSKPSRRIVDPAPAGARSWVAQDENPWANAYGTPAPGAWRATTSRPAEGRVFRLCSCYLPADARSWDGGALTPADVARLCAAQCS